MSDGSMTNTGPSCPEWRLRAIEPPLGRLASTPAFGPLETPISRPESRTK